MQKIDIFTHVWPQAYFKALTGITGKMQAITARSGNVPMMTDLDRRFEVMDMFGPDYRQVLSLAAPPFEAIATPETALELSRIGSDSLAELCAKHPDRFPGFIGSAPLSNMKGCVDECRRAVEDLGAVGMQIYTNVAGKPLDLEEFAPFFEYMAKAGKPVWLHPARTQSFSDYQTEDRSEYEIWWTFGWPYETSAAMARMVFSRFFDRFPGLKVITHHAGGMVPFFEGRVGPGWDQMGKRTTDRDLTPAIRDLKRPHLDYFREFYADTASFGSRRAIAHAVDFFGEDRVLFASDAPFDPEGGPMYIRETIRILDALDDKALQKKIYQDNAVNLLGLKL
jgi:predicted TIM-barrel fold metal-dependent hydrolase